MITIKVLDRWYKPYPNKVREYIRVHEEAPAISMSHYYQGVHSPEFKPRNDNPYKMNHYLTKGTTVSNLIQDAGNNFCKESILTLWNYFLKNNPVDSLPEKASIQQNQTLVRCALELLRTTGELLLLFPCNSVFMSEWMKKTNCKLCNRACEDFPHSFPDCSFIFPDLNLKLSMKLHKFCSKSSEDSLLFVAWMLLRILLVNLRKMLSNKKRGSVLSLYEKYQESKKQDA
ncbi:hypothetical protein HELRODRAFT_162621 [Helobdella robusta]|uniref:Uncharacterized protein n=1 Tax=Helobdella robusta TaxID=6412 RepID=T1ESX7_HELRO|nr:hypothetical protein HELRODRAFT_162621 [Helobdella robusta]ESN99127.1 hypothetical protein HELRODRAFT_162621 [Helobdella robusta]